MKEQWIETLKVHPLFKGITEEEITRMFACLSFQVKLFQKDEYIALEGDPITCIGIIMSGEVMVHRESPTGERIILTRLKDKGMFGEVAAYTKGQWMASALATKDTEILLFPPAAIFGFCPNACFSHQILIKNMLYIVSEKALLLQQKVQMLSLKSIRKKVSWYLLLRYEQVNDITFTIPLKRQDLSDYLQVTRPSLSRELMAMKEDGLIEYKGNQFKLLNLNLMEQVMMN